MYLVDFDANKLSNSVIVKPSFLSLRLPFLGPNSLRNCHDNKPVVVFFSGMMCEEYHGQINAYLPTKLGGAQSSLNCVLGRCASARAGTLWKRLLRATKKRQCWAKSRIAIGLQPAAVAA
jgi:hypothetical protein